MDESLKLSLKLQLDSVVAGLELYTKNLAAIVEQIKKDLDKEDG